MGEGRHSFHGKVELLRESLLFRFTRGDPGEPAVGTQGRLQFMFWPQEPTRVCSVSWVEAGVLVLTAVTQFWIDSVRQDALGL